MRHQTWGASEYDLVEPNIAHDADDDAACEYIVAVEWVQAVARAEAKWSPKSGLYTTTHIRASLDAQPTTTAYIEDAFGVDLGALADGQAN